MWSNTVSLVGLVITFFGAVVTARSVILSDDQALHIGLARYSSGSPEENLKLPSVQNLLSSSRGARRGLIAIAIGTFLQACPILVSVTKELLGSS